MLEVILFAILAAAAVVTALLVILQRNPVASAIFLILTFFCLAGIYLLLNAPFLAAIQVLVYAGAIMVLFLFVIMLLNLEKEQKIIARRSSCRSSSGFFSGPCCWFRSDRFSFFFPDGGKAVLSSGQSGRPGQYGGGCPAPVHRFPAAF